MDDSINFDATRLERRSLGAEPRPDESLIGFVARLAERQHIQTVNTLFFQIGMPAVSNRFYNEPATALASLAGTDVDKIRAISYGPTDSSYAEFRGRRLPSRMLDVYSGKWRRVCPQCLVEFSHHRCWWDVQAISACPVHAVSLIDGCPKCFEPFRWGGATVVKSFCDCGMDLRHLACTTVPHNQVIATAVMHGLLGDERFRSVAQEFRELLPLDDLDDGLAAEFLFRLGLDLLGPRSKPFSAFGTRDLISKSHVALALAVDAIAVWPERLFEAFKARMTSDDPQTSGHANKSLAAMRRWVGALPAHQGGALRAFLAGRDAL